VGVNGLGVAKSDVLRLRGVSGGNGSSEERLPVYLNVEFVVMLVVGNVMISAVLRGASAGWLVIDVCYCL
jgi:hypothetical protein